MQKPLSKTNLSAPLSQKVNLKTRRAILKNSLALFAGLMLPNHLYAQQKLTIGFVFSGTIHDQGFNAAHIKGIEHLKNTLGEQVEIAIAEKLDSGSVKSAIEDLIEQGAKLIFMTDSKFSHALKELAPQYPKIHFEQIGIETRISNEIANISLYDARTYEGQYLLGMLAGLISKTHQIGFVAAEPSARSLMDINAFALGAKQANSKNKIIARWVGEWQKSEKEAELAEDLILNGCDVLGQQTGSKSPVEIASRHQVFCFGINHQNDETNNPWLISSLIINWGNYYVRRSLDQLRNKWEKKISWDGLNTGLIELSPFQHIEEQAHLNKIDNIRTELSKSQRFVFEGPIFDRSETLIVPAETRLNDDQIIAMDWINDNAITEQTENKP
ncbi:MAG: BMP family ABC transporter substrate-binding protein [Pseudomonadota bacterium]